MNRKIILSGMALIFGIFLLVSSSFVVSAYTRSSPQYFNPGSSSSYLGGQGVSLSPGSWDDSKCGAGQDFIIQVDPLGCEPSVVRSDLIEEQEVPVFCQLKATKVNPLITVEAIDYLLNDPNDEGFFMHYIDRIKTYYEEDIQGMALLILDNACKESEYWSESDILNTVKTHIDIKDEKIKETLDLIWSDHYFYRQLIEGKRYYKFKYSILQNWWKMNRG